MDSKREMQQQENKRIATREAVETKIIEGGRVVRNKTNYSQPRYKSHKLI